MAGWEIPCTCRFPMVPMGKSSINGAFSSQPNGAGEVGVLPRDPSHGEQRGGAHRGGAAVSGARWHLSAPHSIADCGGPQVVSLVS